MHLHKERQFMQIPKASVWAMALVMGLGSVAAVAQPRHGQGQGQGPDGPQQRHGHGGKGSGPKHQQGPRMQAQPAHPGHPHGMPPGQAKRMGAGPNHQWVKGSRVPAQYRTSHYVVTDWRGHGLRQPPRGYHWMQYGGDYLLVAIGSGVILQLILNN